MSQSQEFKMVVEGSEPDEVESNASHHSAAGEEAPQQQEQQQDEEEAAPAAAPAEEHVSIAAAEDDADDRASKSTRSHAAPKRKASGMLGDAHSERSGKSSARMTRSASFMASEFNNDADREKTHLKEANDVLEARLRKLRGDVSELRSQGLSRDAQRNLQQLEEDNAAVRKEIDALRQKVGAVSNVETLDKLTDELATREVDLKSIEVRVKNLSEENYANAKLVKKEQAEDPQAVFLDLKNERRRFQKRLDKQRANIDKSREAHEAITKRLRDIEEQEKSLGLDHLSHEEITSTQKKFEANNERLDKLRRKLVSFEGTFSVRSMQTARKSQNIADEVAELQGRVRSLESQVMKLEQTIMANQRLKERPPHFIEPMEMRSPAPISLSGTQQDGGSPRPHKPLAPAPLVSPRQKQQHHPPAAAKPVAKPAKKAAAPSPPKAAKKKTEKPAKTASKPASSSEASSPAALPPQRDEQDDSGRLDSLGNSGSRRSPSPARSSPAATPSPVRTPTPDEARHSPKPPSEPRADSAAPRTPTPAASEPAARTPTPPAEEAAARTPTPPAAETSGTPAARTPTPPAEETSARTPTPPAEEAVARTPTPPAAEEAAAAEENNDEEDGYGDDFDEAAESPKKEGSDDGQPAFLTE